MIDDGLNNVYGSSESVGIGITEVTNEKNMVIALPMHNVKCFITDIDEKILPPLVQGQLFVSGPSVTLGYVNVEYNKDTYGFFNNKKVVKTGDLAFFNSDLEIRLCGRIDGQLKLRGQRLEIGEIMSLLDKFPNIKNNAVILHEINGSEHLIAYYVGDGEVNVKALKNFLESKLPMYMVPSFLIALEEIPLNVNGKVDKRALLDVYRTNLHAEYVAPNNDVEKQL